MLLYCYNTCLSTANHAEIMSRIEKKMAPYYDQLALEFCIAKTDIMTIRATALTKVNSPWHGLNAVVDTWLRGNYGRYSEVKPNVKWLVDAVKKSDNVLGEKLATGIHTYCCVYTVIIVMNNYNKQLWDR